MTMPMPMPMPMKKAMKETETHSVITKKRATLTDEGLSFNNNDSVQFCDELIEEILIRLSAKPLFRSKCVCKRWRHMISDQSFLGSFLRRSKSLPPLISGFFYDYRTDRSARGFPNFIHTSNSVINNHALAFLTMIKGPIDILDSNNGLLLCREKPKPSCTNKAGIKVKPSLTTRFIICNPLTQQWVTLPETRQLQNWDGILLSTYNVDMVCAEFVVVCLRALSGQLHVRKYSSETGIWEGYKAHGNTSGVNRAVLFKDYACWLNKQEMVSVYNWKLKDYRIGFIKFPQDHLRREHSKLQVSGGCLCFIEAQKLTCVKIWVIVNGVEWELMHHIPFTSKVDLLAIHPLDCNLVIIKFSLSSAISLHRKVKGTWWVISDHPLLPLNSEFPSSCLSVKIVPYLLPAWPTSIPRVSNK